MWFQSGTVHHISTADMRRELYAPMYFPLSLWEKYLSLMVYNYKQIYLTNTNQIDKQGSHYGTTTTKYCTWHSRVHHHEICNIQGRIQDLKLGVAQMDWKFGEVQMDWQMDWKIGKKGGGVEWGCIVNIFQMYDYHSIFYYSTVHLIGLQQFYIKKSYLEKI